MIIVLLDGLQMVRYFTMSSCRAIVIKGFPIVYKVYYAEHCTTLILYT